MRLRPLNSQLRAVIVIMLQFFASAERNGSKGAKGPAEWLPPNRAHWCTYLAEWVEIKRRWYLAMDQAEANAIRKGLAVCGRYRSGDHLDGRH